MRRPLRVLSFLSYGAASRFLLICQDLDKLSIVQVRYPAAGPSISLLQILIFQIVTRK